MRLMDIVNSIVTLPSLGMNRNAPTPVVEKVEEEEVVVNEDKLKHTITKKEWSKIPKYNKHIGMDINYGNYRIRWNRSLEILRKESTK
jgi:hypothetical protein